VLHPDAGGGAQMGAFAIGAALAGLDGDAVVADREMRAGDFDILAHLGIEAVRVGAVMRCLDA